MAERGLCPTSILDPEDPRCARVIFSGEMVEITDSSELSFAMEALFERHPKMENWPTEHDWKTFKINFDEICLQDIFGSGMFYFYFRLVFGYTDSIFTSCFCS